MQHYTNASQSVALIDAVNMTASQLQPFKLAIVLAAEPSSFATLLEFAAGGGSVIVVGGACRNSTLMQNTLGISVAGPDILTTSAALNVSVRTDAYADAWNLRVLSPRNVTDEFVQAWGSHGR